MSVITKVPEPNIWDVICRDFASRKPPFKDDDAESINTHLSDYDPARHNPVFFQDEQMHTRVETDAEEIADFDPAKCHPSMVGHAFIDRPPKSPPATPPPPPAKDTCSPREYLDHHVFPVLLPALEEMLKQAKLEKCFERKRTKFNALDFLTEYLYSHNAVHEDREGTELAEIPFVKEWWKDHPRPPLPKSLLWSEEEAGLIIQSFWRGFKIRRDPEVQELRKWQKEWREENENIHNKVDTFWAKKMPEDGEDEPESAREGSTGSRNGSAGKKESRTGTPVEKEDETVQQGTEAEAVKDTEKEEKPASPQQ